MSSEESQAAFYLQIAVAAIVVLCFTLAFRTSRNRSRHRRITADDWNSFRNAHDSPTQLVIIANAMSGRGRARELVKEFQEIIAQSPCEIISIERIVWTERRGHAEELAKGWQADSAKIVVLFGGDGLVHEFANGLLLGNVANPPAIAVVPAGTGNALAKTLGLDPGDAWGAAMKVLRGKVQDMDVLEVSGKANEAQLHRFAVMMIVYGIIADVDHDSERFRWLGSLRFHVEALVKICTFCEKSGTMLLKQLKGMMMFEGSADDATNSLKYFPRHGIPSVGKMQPTLSLEDKEEPGPFVGIILANGPFLSHDMQFMPWASLSDGLIDAALLRGISRWSLLWDLFLNVEDGSHVDRQAVKATMRYYKTQSVELVDLDPQSVLDIDGEFFRGVCSATVQIRQGALRIVA